MQLRRPGTDPRFESTRVATDEHGVARFEELDPGRIYVGLSHDFGERTDIAAGETKEVDYEISAGLHVTGIVVDDSGSPVAGARIEAAPMARSDAFPELVTVSGADGRFSARSCPRACLIGARAAGFKASAVRFFLSKDGNNAEVKLVLARGGGSVEGRVLAAGGEPVANCAVIVGKGELSGIGGRDHLPPFPALVRTDADGRYRAVGLEAGKHPVRARATGWMPYTGDVAVSAWQTTPFHIELSQGATVRGIVRDKEDKPVARAEIEVGNWRDVAHFRTLSDSSGAYSLAGLPAGQIELRAEHSKLGRANKAVRAVGGTTSECDLKLSRGLELIGRVVRENGKGVPKILVECQAENGAWFSFERTDEEGRFAAANCPEGDTIRVSIRGRGIEELMKSEVDPRDGELLLHATSELPRTVRIKGTVLGPDGTPVANATVGGWREGTRDRPGLRATDNEGAFEIGPLVPGNWTIYVRSNAHPKFQSESRVLVANGVWDLGTIRLGLGGAAVVSARGNTKASYYVSDTTFTRSFSVATVEDKKRSEMLAPGRYLLVVRGTGIAAHCVPFEIRAGRDTTVEVDPAPGITQEFVFTLPAGLTGERGVRLLVTHGKEFVGRGYARIRRNQPATTKLWLPKGQLTVKATAGSASGTATFTVGEQQAGPVRIELR